MSNVSTILTALEDQVSSTLGANWQELKYVYDLEKNDGRANDMRYGIGVGAGETVPGTTKSVTMDHNFFVVLTRGIVNRSDGTQERAAISEIYDEFEQIQINVFQKKLGIPSVVHLVSSITMEEPEVIGSGTISIRGNFTIKHRNNT